MNRMKKLWAVLLLLVASGQVFADEGMWVLKELNKQNLERMKELDFGNQWLNFLHYLQKFQKFV